MSLYIFLSLEINKNQKERNTITEVQIIYDLLSSLIKQKIAK